MGFYRHGNKWNLIAPFASRNLEEYMAMGKIPTSTQRGGLRLAADLTSALMVIHRGGDDPVAHHFAGYHHDLKPSNILVCDKIVSITDFGCIKVKKEKDTELGCKLSYWSPLHVETQEDRTVSYRAPEYHPLPPTASTGRAGDIWSLGCILAVILVWLFEGPAGVSRFHKARETIRHSPEGDIITLHAFHNGLEVKPEVLDWLGDLEAKEAGAYPWIRHIVHLIRRMLETNPERRPTAAEVLQLLNMYIENSSNSADINTGRILSDDETAKMEYTVEDTCSSRDLSNDAVSSNGPSLCVSYAN